ncbi:MAG: MaoC family dehydratase [Acidimicrobiia bacterium]|nr:MaoC family dehydratase [Acidimicrobiia bacterium]NNF10492.1 MaoC family dehydratase [Acidimicrobiia bacterium]NNL70191.1 MaoC family dehydratase [Acidimicrobiia bacterium]
MVGEELGTSEWFTIDQDRINAFAEVTVDHQFIHIDRERAAATPLGGTIAHGFLTLSLVTHLTSQIGVMPENMVMVFNYGLDRLRFVNPVRAGSRVRAHTKLLDVTDKGPGQLLIKTGVTVEIDGEDKPALVAETLMMAVTAG